MGREAAGPQRALATSLMSTEEILEFVRRMSEAGAASFRLERQGADSLQLSLEVTMLTPEQTASREVARVHQRALEASVAAQASRVSTESPDALRRRLEDEELGIA